MAQKWNSRIMDVQVVIWDPRADSSRRAITLVAPQSMTQLTQVQVSSDGHVITAGARNGHVSSQHIWAPIWMQTYCYM